MRIELMLMIWVSKTIRAVGAALLMLCLMLFAACKQHGSHNEQLRTHYDIGLAHADSGELPDALEAFHAAAACADTTANDCDYHTLSLVHCQMAEIFHRHYQPQTAIAELKEAQRLLMLAT